MLGPPVVWITYFEVIYARVMPACADHSKSMLFLYSVVCLALIAGCGLLSRRALASGTEVKSHRLMGHVGLMAAALFALVTIAQTIAMFIMDPCLM
jgi:hypothetical protein